MACQAIHSWTFCGLLGAFLDLAIAYFLLCCSTVAFVITKFLGLFGLSLPCPCNGLFGYRSHPFCLQRLLVDCPADTVSSVQLSIKGKFPFDLIFSNNEPCQLNLKLVRERRLDDGRVELEGEASCSSFSEARRSRSLSGIDSFLLKDGRFDVKGKGFASQRHRCGLRRRRRGSIDHGKPNSSSSYDYLNADVRVVPFSPSIIKKMHTEASSETSVSVNFQDGKEHPELMESEERMLPDSEANNEVEENKSIDENTESLEYIRTNAGHEIGIGDLEENTVKILEQAIEEEQAARAALYSELEKERVAAATAADEAMAMISRLQEEKASIEMEARQYHRILEEKSAYDYEEMNILKEIIVRREREKHFLENDVEAYRKMLLENGQLEGSMHDAGSKQVQDTSFLLDPIGDPEVMLQQLSESIDRKGKVQSLETYPDYASGFVEKQTCSVYLEKGTIMKWDDKTEGVVEHGDCSYSSIKQNLFDSDDGVSQETEEKGIVSTDEYLHAAQGEVDLVETSDKVNKEMSPEKYYREKKVISEGEQGLNIVCPQKDTATRLEKTCDGSDILYPSYAKDIEPHIHDVHVIDTKCDICNKGGKNRHDCPPIQNNASNVVRKSELPLEASDSHRIDDLESSSDAASLETQPEINRSCSDIASCLSPVSSSYGGKLLPDMRRKSMSAVDQERLKLNNEVEWLRERLRIIQKGKEKLKFLKDHQERSKTELQLLEDIANQLREIRQLTAPQKATRQGSLPPLSSKVRSKRRRPRSGSGGICDSI